MIYTKYNIKKSLSRTFWNYYSLHYQLGKILYSFTWSCFFIIFYGRDHTSLINYVSKYIGYTFYSKIYSKLTLYHILQYNLIYKVCYFSKIAASTI